MEVISMSNFSESESGGTVVQFSTPSDVDLIRELRLAEIYRKHGLMNEYQSLLNVTITAMISRDRDNRLRQSMILVSLN
jgi:hypothetical protein